MRRNRTALVAVAVLGVAAGTAIAGLPGGGSEDDFVIGAGSNATAVTASSTTLAPAVTAAVVTTVPAAVTTVSVASQAPIPTTIPPTTVPVTAVPVTTVAPTTTVVETLPRDQVRVVLANGDGRFNLVGRNADRLLALGYVTIDQTDVSDRPLLTIVYWRPGFDDEAAVLAADLQTPGALLLPLPDTPVTGNDAAGDLVVVLGPDALR